MSDGSLSVRIRITEVSEGPDMNSKLGAAYYLSSEFNALLSYTTDNYISEISSPSSPEPQKLEHCVTFEAETTGTE
jgi:hypothetical protein